MNSRSSVKVWNVFVDIFYYSSLEPQKYFVAEINKTTERPIYNYKTLIEVKVHEQGKTEGVKLKSRGDSNLVKTLGGCRTGKKKGLVLGVAARVLMKKETRGPMNWVTS